MARAIPAVKTWNIRYHFADKSHRTWRIPAPTRFLAKLAVVDFAYTCPALLHAMTHATRVTYSVARK